MPDTIDQQFVEYIVKTLVNNPDAVSITRTIDEKGVLLELRVDPADLGRVIGRSGTTAKSIRTLLRALSVKHDARFNLKIIDTNEEDDVAGAGAVPTQEEPAAQAQPADGPVDASVDDTIVQPDHSEQSDAESDVVERHRREIDELTEDF